MLNTLDEYICSSIPAWEEFSTNPNLRKKVDGDGKLLPYLGNTVVFLLDEDTKQKLCQIREALYRAAGEMLAEPLQTATFHMTLHDLANGQPGQWCLREWMADTQARAGEILCRWKGSAPIRMKATWMFNMVSTSIVLGLAPADGDSWRRLDEMYTALEDAVPLSYALTPHITLAYYRPGTYSQEQAERLAGVLRPVDMEVELRMENLVLQEFTDMNHYETIF